MKFRYLILTNLVASLSFAPLGFAQSEEEQADAALAESIIMGTEVDYAINDMDNIISTYSGEQSEHAEALENAIIYFENVAAGLEEDDYVYQALLDALNAKDAVNDSFAAAESALGTAAIESAAADSLMENSLWVEAQQAWNQAYLNLTNSMMNTQFFGNSYMILADLNDIAAMELDLWLNGGGGGMGGDPDDMSEEL